jgi:hypothetical protein
MHVRLAAALRHSRNSALSGICVLLCYTNPYLLSYRLEKTIRS